jgi:hypothetical protein
MTRRPHKGKVIVDSPASEYHADAMMIRPQSIHGDFYVYTFVNYYGYTVVFYTNTRSVMVEVFLQFLTKVPGKVTKYIPDGGGELVSNEIRAICKEKEIECLPTPPYTPQVNGLVEQRQYKNVSRTSIVFADSGIPHKYWEEAMNWATILCNIMIPVGRSRSPYECTYGRKPDVSIIRRWGCKLEYLNPSEIRGPQSHKIQNKRGKEDGSSVCLLNIQEEPFLFYEIVTMF